MFNLVPMLVLAVTVSLSAAPQRAQPDLVAQRSAMRKLGFLVGKWSGQGRIFRGPGTTEFVQTEDADYKLDGLVLMIEGVGRNKADGKYALQALGIVSYDDAAGMYWMRAYNDGRYLETEMKLGPDGKSLHWGFASGEIRMISVLRIDENGDWTESHEVVAGSRPPQTYMELRVRRQR